MISSPTLILLILLAIAFYLLFFEIPMPRVARNILGIVAGIVLLVIVLNLLGALPWF